MTIRNLEFLFKPKSVALIGASNQTSAVGPTLARRLREDGAQGFLVKPVQSQELALALLPYVRGGQRNYP